MDDIPYESYALGVGLGLKVYKTPDPFFLDLLLSNWMMVFLLMLLSKVRDRQSYWI